MKQIIGITCISLLMQACVANPVKREQNQPMNPDRFSLENIKQERETDYAKKLIALSQRNPVEDARHAVASDNTVFLTYQSGRGSTRKVPGLTQQQIANSRCGFKALTGLGDTIYGESHLKYRVALRRYANQFNQAMLPYCR